MTTSRLHPAGFRERALGVLGLLVALPLAGCSESKSDSASHPPPGNEVPDASPAVVAGPPIPAATEACPTLATGTQTFSGTAVTLFVGERQEDRKGPVLFYWHGTGSIAGEGAALMQPQIDEVVAEGGIVASFSTSTGTGDYTGPFVWYSDDYKMADQILACAVQQLNIDTRRIYSAGCSAGGLQSSAMMYMRSSYLAAAMPNSGGTITPPPLEDPSHVPSVMMAHGALGSDKVVIEFTDTSNKLAEDITEKGGFAVNCDHGGGHCGAPPDLKAAQWQFLKDHPFGVSPEPYADGLPADFPSYCKIQR